jgi:MinD-like ATPase involved in chromosome partitioning or flagellar assembly
MSRIVAIHSFRGGTGKSNTTANLAALLALSGRRVGVIDTDIQSPGIHVLFNLDPTDIRNTLNDFLWGKCDISRCVYDVTPETDPALPGKLFLVPSSIKSGDIARVLHYGYDVNLLNDGYQALIREMNLDCLFVDTHPGLNEETLLSMAIAEVLIILLRPDYQDYQGTAVTVEVSRQLEVPRMYLVVNKVPDSLDRDALAKKMAETYQCEVIGVLPHDDDMSVLASSGLFAVHYREHEITRVLQDIVNRIEAAS